MAESTGSSKAAKKNQKKRQGNKIKSQPEGQGDTITKQNVVGAVDPIQEIRDQLAEAKANKDHSLANELRQKLWIAQDLNAGFNPAIDKNDHDAKKLLNKVTRDGLGAESKTTIPVPSPTVTSTPDQDEKKMRNLQKKLKKIEELKQKKEAGEKLQDNQLKKIESEAEILEDIKHLQKLISIPAKT